MNTFRWKEIMAGTPVTGLRTGRVGTEEAIPGCLMFILGRGAGAGGPQGDFRQGRRKQTRRGRRKEEAGCSVL